jgi:hypothetical protein
MQYDGHNHQFALWFFSTGRTDEAELSQALRTIPGHAWRTVRADLRDYMNQERRSLTAMARFGVGSSDPRATSAALEQIHIKGLMIAREHARREGARVEEAVAA